MSPIEDALISAILSNVPSGIALLVGDELFSGADDYHRLIEVERQFSVGSYRVDFMFTMDGSPPYRLAVECDGHEWHERTKQQAAYDRARDRELLASNVLTIRFTGSEIHHSAERCASEVAKALGVLASINDMEMIGWMRGCDYAELRECDPSPGRIEEHW